MSEAKFTRGPWRLRSYDWKPKDDYGNWRWSGSIGPDKPITKGDTIRKGSEGGTVLSTSAFGIFGHSAKEAEANARLIAAAPTLYSALENAMRALEKPDRSQLSVRKAVAKAAAAIALATEPSNHREDGE